MANELVWRHTATGETVYATIRSAARTMWNGAALEALTVLNWADYDIALSESPAGGYFHVGTWPAGLTDVGWYYVDIYSQAGAGPAIDDTFLGTLYGYWDGTKFEPAGGDVAQWKGATAAAMTGDAYARIGAPAGASLAADIAAIAAYVDAEVGQILGATAGKKIINSAGTEVQVYDRAGALLVTLTRTGVGPYTWTPVWA